VCVCYGRKDTRCIECAVTLLNPNLSVFTCVLTQACYVLLCENFSFALFSQVTARGVLDVWCFKNTVLMRIFRPKRDGGTEEWRKLHNRDGWLVRVFKVDTTVPVIRVCLYIKRIKAFQSHQVSLLYCRDSVVGASFVKPASPQKVERQLINTATKTRFIFYTVLLLLDSLKKEGDGCYM
jgi:hypothetical protein